MNREPFDQARAVFFDNLAEGWDGQGPVPAADRVEGFLRKLTIVAGEVILDVGTGTGLMIPYLMEFAPEKVIAMDISAKMLKRVTDKYQDRYGSKLEVLHNDAHGLALDDGSVDVIICNGVFPHFHDKPKAVAELYRVLRPGGRLTVNHFAGKAKINAIHAAAAHELIRNDILDDAQTLAGLMQEIGFIVRETADTEQEFFLLAVKPGR